MAGFTVSAVGCLIAGVMTLGTIGAELFVMGVVFTIAAVATRCLIPPPSSELTSTNLSPLVDAKQR
ncbi:hypothetical protein GOM44_02140 [Wolbachia endosymbiont of Atemnus politus]|nr:hypothetical protein [Wolbachia endosymbiont of Atemnus politus]